MYVSLEVLPSIGIVNACLDRGFTLYRELLIHVSLEVEPGIGNVNA